MGFLIYKRTNIGQTVRYQRIRPLKLAGMDGLLARHVKALPADETAGWKLETGSLLRVAGVTEDNLTVLFDLTVTDTTAACLYELTRVRGSCRDTTTNLALDFNVVLDCEREALPRNFTAEFETSLGAQPKKFAETLSITGGPGGGDWKWGKPALQLGATVVQAHQDSART